MHLHPSPSGTNIVNSADPKRMEFFWEHFDIDLWTKEIIEYLL
jgi:hypothetical protein